MVQAGRKNRKGNPLRYDAGMVLKHREGSGTAGITQSLRYKHMEIWWHSE